MKKRKTCKTLIVLSLVLGVFVTSVITNNKTIQANQSTEKERELWNMSQDYIEKNNQLTYHSYLSKDKKSAWIYKVEVANGAKDISIVFPSKINNTPVTRIGHSRDLYFSKAEDKQLLSDALYTITGESIEPWHKLYGNVGAVKSVKLPNTVNKIDEGAFCGMVNLKEIVLPDSLKVIENNLFCGDKSLTKITVGVAVRDIEKNAFSGVKNLHKLAIKSANRNYVVKDGFLLNNGKKELLYAIPTKKKLKIPSSVEKITCKIGSEVNPSSLVLGKNVKKISKEFFYNSKIKSIKVAKTNKTFAMSGKSLYKKKNGELVYYLNTTKDTVLGNKIKRVTENSLFGVAHKYDNKITLGSKIKYVDFNAFIAMSNYLSEIIFKGKKIPKFVNKKVLKSFDKLTIRAPKKMKKKYRKSLYS